MLTLKDFEMYMLEVGSIFGIITQLVIRQSPSNGASGAAQMTP